MAQVLINETTLNAIANAIRGVNGVTTTYLPSEMASAISNELCKPFKCISDNTVYTKETCPYATVDFTKYNMTLIRDYFCYRNTSTATDYSGCGAGAGSYIADKLIFPHVKKIGGWAFYNTSFGSIEIPEAEELGKSAFGGSKGFADINIPKVKKIGTFSFSETNLEKIIISDDATTIGASAFKDNSKLKKVVIGAGVTSIGSEAFGMSSTGPRVIYFRGTTPPTVGANWVTNPGSWTYTIYVPTGTTNAYKSAVGSYSNITYVEMAVADMPHYDSNGKAVWA